MPLNKIKAYHQSEEDINIMPLIDVIFILLIFFMIASEFNKSILPMDLPQATTGEQQKTHISLSVGEDGRIAVDDQIVELEEISPIISTWVASTPEGTISIASDEQVDFGMFVKVLDEIRKGGGEKIGIQYESSGP
ncbi:ExbD/TolR family protein [Spirochaeta cellobiosiphila]|uniref:ExbD/TolR family protein n=1 Tax=Spirochaeta cellobiosiphila TaxID=504483 RepID=UPI0003FEBD0B|nr:biopolymer transporter ExbD [Spirochaeta cellobiosiphila]